ncbi:HAD family hydrolase [Thermohalobacter berrensis]|uniref:HAD family hydrolase n=1 Tax=Thermohalobacter berrensis TaxID=99594 RepID=A0A419T287_9FIRM|nr:HAD family hydrolase [Thermohalobacter berrensis]RKD31566.1 HAD family hydrolase [Thermohalobacter berrensis]
MKYKLLAIDLDGTLLTTNKKLPKENIKVLRLLYKKGIEIVIATGRRYWSAKEFVKKLDIDLVVMANNGNIARRIQDDKVLISKYLDRNDFITLVKESNRLGLNPIMYVDHYEEGYDLIIELDDEKKKYSPYISKNIFRHKEIDDILKYDGNKTLAVCYEGDYETLEYFQNKLKKEYPSKFNTHIMNNNSKIGPLLEVMNPLGSKWLSLKKYAEDKGIAANQIVAIGDDNNDIEMIEKAGLGIGMKNSTQEVKAVADIITKKTNDEAGVAYILKDIFNICI